VQDKFKNRGSEKTCNQKR